MGASKKKKTLVALAKADALKQKEASQALSNMANDMQDAVGQFKF